MFRTTFLGCPLTRALVTQGASHTDKGIPFYRLNIISRIKLDLSGSLLETRAYIIYKFSIKRNSTLMTIILDNHSLALFETNDF